MSCCNNYNGWGGCGCTNTVQYAPPACNPNFPTTCAALGTGTIQRVVGEDSSYCKYTVPTLASNSLLFYNASTGLINWANGTTANPVYLSPSTTSQTSGNLVGLSALSGNNGQVVQVMPTFPVTETTFPIVPIGGSTVNWGTIENIVPSQGLVYKTGTSSSPASTVQTLSTTTSNQVVSFNTTTGDPIIVPASSLFGQSSGFIDVQKIVITPASISPSTNLSVNFGEIVLQTTPGTNGSFNTFVYTNTSALNLNLNLSGAGGLDTGTVAINTYYYVYAIYNQTTSTINTLCSASAYAPALLPTGYTYYRMIGLFRTNSTSSGQIDSAYNQNGRNVNLGPSCDQNVFNYTSSGSNTTIYWSGQFSSSYPSGVTRAYIRCTGRRNIAASNLYGFWNISITNIQVGTTGSTASSLGTSTEIYGSGVMADITSSTTSQANLVLQSYVSTSNLTPYYSIVSNYALATSGDFINISIGGYELNMF